MRRRLVTVGIMLVWATTLSAADNAPAISKPYLDGTIIDLTQLLPPPPPADSAETKAELGELLVIQVTRTPEMVSRAQADAVEEIWRFADVLGPKFTPDALPKTAVLFERLVATDNAVIEPAKTRFNRQRPYIVSDLIKPVVKQSTAGSWPSSHSSIGTLMGVVLGNMLPEKRATIMDRARAYAENRLVAGTQFPSDVEMGRISGTVIAAFLLRDPGFLADFGAARAEVRTALGFD